MLSDTDIKDELDKKEGIVIDPFDDSCLTPVGYDLRVGEWAFSWKDKCGVEINQGRSIRIKPNDTMVIETHESVKLPKNIGATIHSRATKVCFGLSHISTTVDPGWSGKMLVSIHNHRDSAIRLRFKDSFCTVCFYRMQSSSVKNLYNPPDRKDLKDQLLEKSAEEKDRSNKRRIRLGLFILFFIAVVIVAIIKVSSKNEVLASILATLLAGAIGSIIATVLQPFVTPIFNRE